MKLKLHTTIKEQDAIALALEGSRPNTEFIKVPRQALAHILHDHGQMCHEFVNSLEIEQ